MELLYKNNSGELWYDSEQNVLQMSWFNNVDLISFRNLFLKANELIHANRIGRLVMDYRKLDDFTTSCLVWIKHDFMKPRGVGQNMIKKLKRFAIIKPNQTINHALNQVSIHFITRVFISKNIDLEYKSFYDHQKGLIWITIQSNKVHFGIYHNSQKNFGQFFLRLLGLRSTIR